jgi:type VII secretion-associated serine protease mycosin
MLRRRAAAAAVVLCMLPALAVLASAGPARADSVRDAEQWVLSAINAQAAWPASTGSGVTVAVIDSGVDPVVPDLAGSVRTGPDLTGVHTPSSDSSWGVHGTWMASLIAGHGHDGGGNGIIGVAPDARLLSIRVITDKLDPGYAAYQHQSLTKGQQELARAIRYAVRHRVSVISMSLGYGAPSRPVRAALQDAYAHNVVVVASSGNSGNSADQAGKGSAPYSFPADYPGVLGVAAVGQDWQPASFSSENLSVQVAAPGVNVPAEGRDAQYWLVSGTSPACALAAGVAALVKSKYPGLSDAQVIAAITTSAWHNPAGGYDKQVGFGTVDAAAAITAAGRLVGQEPAGRNVAASSHFGGGPAAVPAPPVRPRGPLALLWFSLLGAACLAIICIAAVRLVLRWPVPDGGQGRPGQPGPPGPPPSAPGWGMLTREEISGLQLPEPEPGPEPQPGGPLEHGQQPGSARFPWQSGPAGRHAAPSDRGSGLGDRR